MVWFVNGFKSPRPNNLPVSAAVWDVASRYDVGGPTVVEALFDAVVQLETRLAKQERGQGTGLIRNL